MQGPHEKRLLHHLLDKYNTLERPVANESEPIQISFGITLMQIIDVVRTIFSQTDEKSIHHFGNAGRNRESIFKSYIPCLS